MFKDVLRDPYSNHKDEIITAIKLLTFLEDKSERDHIANLVRDHDRSIRNAAAKALGDLGDIESIPVLAELVDSTEQAEQRDVEAPPRLPRLWRVEQDFMDAVHTGL